MEETNSQGGKDQFEMTEVSHENGNRPPASWLPVLSPLQRRGCFPGRLGLSTPNSRHRFQCHSASPTQIKVAQSPPRPVWWVATLAIFPCSKDLIEPHSRNISFYLIQYIFIFNNISTWCKILNVQKDIWCKKGPFLPLPQAARFCSPELIGVPSYFCILLEIF